MKFKSPSDARAVALEINYALSNPEEEPMTEEEATAARETLADAKAYLAGADESL